ncbi:MAG: hypothetical protein IJ934_06780 [Acetobacter sp.]|nr:hypothetical protein [Acetobacter sp.]MBR2124843.1 hypothetical protein [Acetobacter sp.]
MTTSRPPHEPSEPYGQDSYEQECLAPFEAASASRETEQELLAEQDFFSNQNSVNRDARPQLDRDRADGHLSRRIADRRAERVSDYVVEKSSDFWGTLIWIIGHFLFCFIQQITELFAPVLLIVGVLWAALPFIVTHLTHSVLSTDVQAQEMLATAQNSLPSSFQIAGYVFSGMGLIEGGLFLMALTAASATCVAYCERRL